MEGQFRPSIQQRFIACRKNRMTREYMREQRKVQKLTSLQSFLCSLITSFCQCQVSQNITQCITQQTALHSIVHVRFSQNITQQTALHSTLHRREHYMLQYHKKSSASTSRYIVYRGAYSFSCIHSKQNYGPTYN